MTMNPQATISTPGGLSVVRAPRPPRRGFIGGVLGGLRSLLKGMGVTWYYLTHPSTVVTRQYPENRATLTLHERCRTLLSFIRDEQGQHRCTACRSCEVACPNGSIKIVSRKGPVTNKNEIDQFVWRLDTCTFCNACVIVCPFAALTMSGSFESAVYDRRLLVYSLNPYAGPPASGLQKIESPEDRQRAMEPRRPYSGPIPLLGTPLAGLPAPAAAPIVPGGKP